MNLKESIDLLLQRCQPRLIAVDLDNTLWPGNCFETTSAPYVCNPFQPAPRTVACLDPRTGQGKTISLYPEVREILEFLSARNVPLTICSRSPNKIAAMGILDTLGLWKLFTLPQVYRSRKTYHFRNLRDCLDVEYRDCLHFDDCMQNIEAVTELGVVACPVTVGVGLTWERLLAGLQLFEVKQNEYAKVSTAMVSTASVKEVKEVSSRPAPIAASTSRKHVRWCLEPIYFEDPGSDPEKTDGDDSTDDASSSDGITSPSSEIVPVSLKRKHSFLQDSNISPKFACPKKAMFPYAIEIPRISNL